MSIVKDLIERKYAGEGNSSPAQVPAVLPDWGQNDPEAPDYVKNRTHYAGQAPVEEIATTAFETTDFSYIYGNGLYGVELDGTMCPQSTTSGEVRKIVFDGVEYNCAVQYDSGNAAYVVGNAGMTAYSSLEDTGEPFVWLYQPGRWAYVLTRDTAPTTHTIRSRAMTDVMQQIPEEYIPSTIARIADIPTIPVAEAVADAAGDTPTAAEFNALLAVLRASGLLKN